MITRFDAKGQVHLLDEEEVVDVNLDKVARALLQALFAPRARPPRRLLRPPVRAVARK